MTRHIPMAEFKNRTSKYVAAAEHGEDIVITRHGKPAVTLKSALPPAEAERRKRVYAALDRLAALRAEQRAMGITTTIDEMIAWKNEGRP